MCVMKSAIPVLLATLLIAGCMSTPMDKTVGTPLLMKTGAIDSVNEGKLIVVQGRIVRDIVDDRPWGWKIYLDDGSGKLLVFVTPSARIDVSGFRAGQMLRVTGIIGTYERHVELLPRNQTDIAVLR